MRVKAPGGMLLDTAGYGGEAVYESRRGQSTQVAAAELNRRINAQNEALAAAGDLEAMGAAASGTAASGAAASGAAGAMASGAAGATTTTAPTAATTAETAAQAAPTAQAAPNTGTVQVYFRSSLGASSVRLEQQSIAALAEHFGAQDFAVREGEQLRADGDILAAGELLLTGRAERYVAGWFEEIAFSRGYLRAAQAAAQAAASATSPAANPQTAAAIAAYSAAELDDAHLAELSDYARMSIDADGRVVGLSPYERAPGPPDPGQSTPRSIAQALDEAIAADADFSGRISLDEFIAHKIALGEGELAPEAPALRISPAEAPEVETDELAALILKILERALASDRRVLQGMPEQNAERAKAAAMAAELAAKLAESVADGETGVTSAGGVTVASVGAGGASAATAEQALQLSEEQAQLLESIGLSAQDLLKAALQKTAQTAPATGGAASANVTAPTTATAATPTPPTAPAATPTPPTAPAAVPQHLGALVAKDIAAQEHLLDVLV